MRKTRDSEHKLAKLSLGKETVRALRKITPEEAMHVEGASGGHRGELIYR